MDSFVRVASTKPLVSICCSTYSRPDLFALSLDGMLRQKYEPLEIVVLVDGSHRASIAQLERCRDPRLRWFATDKPSGMIASWNKVVAASKGKYFLYCADDDILCDEAIQPQLEVLETHPDVGFCHADFFLIDDKGEKIGHWQSHEGTWLKHGLEEWTRYLTQPKCCMQTCLVRRELWDIAGGWDEDAGYPGDNSLYLKLLRISDVAHIRRFTCHYRIRTENPDSWLKNAAKVKADFRLAAKHLANPPAALRGEIRGLEKSVRDHCTRNAIAVLADPRGTREQKLEFGTWVVDELLDRGIQGMLYRVILFLHLERATSSVKSCNEFCRGLIRDGLIKLRELTGREFALRKTN
jgi:glycosyltransferase involved in cell wall biosynthesis